MILNQMHLSIVGASVTQFGAPSFAAESLDKTLADLGKVSKLRNNPEIPFIGFVLLIPPLFKVFIHLSTEMMAVSFDLSLLPPFSIQLR